MPAGLDAEADVEQIGWEVRELTLSPFSKPAYDAVTGPGPVP